MSHSSIFEAYYANPEFVDKYEEFNDSGMDVIIPVFHTNELWEVNLKSIYREIPVKRLIISDGGVIDNSIEIVSKFPRVEILDHRHFKSLGKCIAELIASVQTEHFIYLHSDVYLPSDWYNNMIKYKDTYDWYGCPMNITYMYSLLHNDENRPYAGSQMGRKDAFTGVEKFVGDDYVYRFEDFVFDEYVKSKGYKTGKISDTFHYHQSMYRQTSGLDLKVKSVQLNVNKSPEELIREVESSILTFIKYLDKPEYFELYKSTLNGVIQSSDDQIIQRLVKLIILDKHEAETSQLNLLIYVSFRASSWEVKKELINIFGLKKIAKILLKRIFSKNSLLK